MAETTTGSESPRSEKTYADHWREGISRANIRMGTTAIAKLGDISRDDPDYFRVDWADDENYYGAWLTGFGFFDVRFPKDSTRPLTSAEREWLLDHPVVIG